MIGGRRKKCSGWRRLLSPDEKPAVKLLEERAFDMAADEPFGIAAAEMAASSPTFWPSDKCLVYQNGQENRAVWGCCRMNRPITRCLGFKVTVPHEHPKFWMLVGRRKRAAGRKVPTTTTASLPPLNRTHTLHRQPVPLLYTAAIVCFFLSSAA